jgi:ABC-type nitrate/sulfonate/bicarbonate transport system substrate-binding protein
MKKVRIAGVPEHFNLPWHLCIEEGSFEDAGIDLEWIDVPEGTGKMCQMLESDETDLALVLTEGIIKAIAAGNPSKIIQNYVASPLIWGVHTGFQRNIDELMQKPNPTVAISRLGSGSHLMAFVWAKNRGLNPNNLQFEVVHTLEGAKESLINGNSDFFLWERFTTQPLVTAKIFKRVGECPTPWPCFVLAGRSEFITKEKHTLTLIQEIIEPTLDEFSHIPSIDRTIASRYDLEIDEVRQWLGLTRWSTNDFDEETLNLIQNQLMELGLMSKKITFADIVHR